MTPQAVDETAAGGADPPLGVVEPRRVAETGVRSGVAL